MASHVVIVELNCFFLGKGSTMKQLTLLVLLISTSVFSEESALKTLNGVWLQQYCKLIDSTSVEGSCDFFISNIAYSMGYGYVLGLRHGMNSGFSIATQDPKKAQELSQNILGNEMLQPLLLTNCSQGKQGKQLSAVVRKYLENHPEKLHKYYLELIDEALTEAFPPPCVTPTNLKESEGRS